MVVLLIALEEYLITAFPSPRRRIPSTPRSELVIAKGTLVLQRSRHRIIFLFGLEGQWQRRSLKFVPWLPVSLPTRVFKPLYSTLPISRVVHGVLETLRTSHMATFSALLTKIQAELWNSAEEIKQELNARLKQLSEKPDHLTMTKQILDHTVSFDAYFEWNRDRECVNDIILFDVLSY
jgi:hypothetical protein